MKVLAYPSDNYGCGHYRVIYPCEALIAQGADITIVRTEDRHVKMNFQHGKLIDVELPSDIDVVVLQRPTNRLLLQFGQWLIERGIALVVDVDDDLSAIHPGNPAWQQLDPNRAKREAKTYCMVKNIPPAQLPKVEEWMNTQYTHSWLNLIAVCKIATLVTVSTPGLLRRYAVHGRGVVLPNYLPEAFFKLTHHDSDVIGWPAALHSHPNDPAVVGGALARLVNDQGARFTTISDNPTGIARAFGLHKEHPAQGVPLDEWPAALTQLGVGIAPLADTRFNMSKSWLKPLELSAAGVPWVASPRAEYTRLHRLGVGVLAEKPREWYRELSSLVQDPSRRHDLSQAGLEVARGLRVVDHANEWLDAWARAMQTVQDLPEIRAGSQRTR